MVPVSLLSAHGLALLCLVRKDRARISDIAAAINDSEFVARRVVADLVDAGLLLHRREGRLARYEVRPDLAEILLDEKVSQLATMGAAPTPERNDVRRELESRLRQAIERLFAQEQPYAAVSVERLIQEADIPRTTFYAHFRGKDDVLICLASGMLEEAWAISDFWTGGEQSDYSKAGLQRALEQTFAAYSAPRGVMAAIGNAMAPGSRIRAELQQLWNHTATRMGRVLTARKTKGIVRPDISPGATATWLTWLGESFMYRMVTNDSRTETETMLAAMTDMIWAAVYASEQS